MPGSTWPACRPSSKSCTEYATSSAQSMTWASKQVRFGGAPRLAHSKTGRSSSYTPNFTEPGSVGWAPCGQGYFVAASRTARVRLRPTLTRRAPPPVSAPASTAASAWDAVIAGGTESARTKRFGSIRVSSRSDWALPSKPPQSLAKSLSTCSPLWPNGGCPMSCERHAVSTRSGSQPSAAPSSRPTWAHSREWVSRVRGLASHSWLCDPGVTTWVLPARRRRAEECRTRARSR